MNSYCGLKTPILIVFDLLFLKLHLCCVTVRFGVLEQRNDVRDLCFPSHGVFIFGYNFVDYCYDCHSCEKCNDSEYIAGFSVIGKFRALLLLEIFL